MGKIKFELGDVMYSLNAVRADNGSYLVDAVAAAKLVKQYCKEIHPGMCVNVRAHRIGAFHVEVYIYKPNGGDASDETVGDVQRFMDMWQRVEIGKHEYRNSVVDACIGDVPIVLEGNLIASFIMNYAPFDTPEWVAKKVREGMTLADIDEQYWWGLSERTMRKYRENFTV